MVATTGDQGLALAERHRPSAIVLDVGLPDRSGLSVLDTLKHRSTTRHIPVHVVSVSDYTQTALEMGATGYAIKPVKRDELVGALKRLETKFTQRLRRILVVEDDDVARDSTCRLLAGARRRDGRGRARPARRWRRSANDDLRLHGARSLAARSQRLRAAGGDVEDASATRSRR